MTFMKTDDVIMHAHMIMDNGFLIVPPHNFEDQSCLNNQLWKIKEYYCGLGSNGINSIPNFIKINSSVPVLLYVVHKASTTSLAERHEEDRQI
jgi:hypothetical protein